jgi:hypothetical protein
MTDYRFVLLILLLPGSACFGANSQLRLFAGLDSIAIATEEVDTKGKELNKESGTLLGAGFGFEWIFKNGIYYGGTLDLGDGDVEYSGVSQLGVPIKNGTSYFYYWRPKVYAGKEIGEWWFKPRIEVEVGGQLKERHIDPRTDGIDGYKETYTWWYSGLGISFEFFGNEDWSWRSGFNYRMMIQPTNDTTIARRDIELGSTASYSLFNGIYLNLDEDLYLGIELNFTKTKMDASRVLYDEVIETEESSAPSWISQPKSSWQDTNLRLAISKRFDF